MTTANLPPMESLLAITSIGRCAQALLLSVSSVQKLMRELGIRPAAKLDGVVYLNDSDLDRMREAVAERRTARPQAERR